MNIEEFFAAIPNSENVDKVYATTVFERLVALKRLMVEIKDAPFLIKKFTANGSSMVANPLYQMLRNEEMGVRQGLNELCLTPKARKALGDAGMIGKIPTLGGPR